jgi:hypothetical protein
MKISFCKKDIDQLIKLSEEKNIFLEGNIVKVIETDSEIFKDYILKAKEKDDTARKKRLEITRQVQDQNKLLEKKAKEKENLMDDLKLALSDAEGAKEAAINDLDLIQKKSQFELMGQIIRVALWVIMSVGVLTSVLYIVALYTRGSGPDTTLIGNTWSNLLGILLTNSFSIVGTIMGVKYANDKKEE